MKTGLAISISLVCGLECLCGTSFARVTTAGPHPHTIESAARVRPNSPPGTVFKAKLFSPSGLLVLSGTTPGGTYRGSSNPALLGRLPRPSRTTPALLAGTGINRKP